MGSLSVNKYYSKPQSLDYLKDSYIFLQIGHNLITLKIIIKFYFLTTFIMNIRIPLRKWSLFFYSIQSVNTHSLNVYRVENIILIASGRSGEHGIYVFLWKCCHFSDFYLCFYISMDSWILTLFYPILLLLLLSCGLNGSSLGHSNLLQFGSSALC